MKKNSFKTQIWLGVLLVALSAVVYLIHYLVFRDAHHIFIYLLGDIAFVFIEVLLVTLIIHQVLSEREKRSMLNKLNMVIGAFFNEVGTELLEHFSAFDSDPSQFSRHLVVDGQWSAKHFAKVRDIVWSRDYKIHCRPDKLAKLSDFAIAKRHFLLGLLENPNLLEHDTFTELLWAVFHVADELANRKSVYGLPESDYEHLGGDIKRAYRLLLRECIDYMEHLKSNYPYLFSLEIRTNPFDPEASVEVK